MQVYPSDALMKFKICKNLDECLSRLIENSKLAVAISREHAHNSLFISPSQFYCFEKSENIYGYGLKFLVHTNSTFLNDLNEFIQRIIESGLKGKWHSDNQISNPKKYIEESYGQLKAEQLLGIYIIWIIGISVIITIYMLERLVYKKVRTLNASRYWKFIEMIIEPDRRF